LFKFVKTDIIIMKKSGFLSFIFAMVIFILSLSSCHQTSPGDEPEIKDTTANNLNVGLPVRATVHIEGPAGAGAGGAMVKIAYTLDSAIHEQYFRQLLTNDSGYVIINDLIVDRTTKTKKYFANASFNQGGKDLNSMNGGLSNGPVGFTEKQTGTPLNISIVVTSY
jgi:hypothetical protein